MSSPARKPSDEGARRGKSTPGTDRKPMLLRVDPQIHAALTKWAADDLRSTNAHVEWLLRRALLPTVRLLGLHQPIPNDRAANVLGNDHLRQTTRTPRNVTPNRVPTDRSRSNHRTRNPFACRHSRREPAPAPQGPTRRR